MYQILSSVYGWDDVSASKMISLTDEGSCSVVIPEYPLSEDAIGVVCTHQRFDQWDATDGKNSLALVKRVAAHWQSEGEHHYLVIGRDSGPTHNPSFEFQVVPYKTSEESPFFQQLIILWRIAIGGLSISEGTRLKLANEWRDRVVEQRVLRNLKETIPGRELGTKDSIRRQSVFVGRHMYVLFDKAPITRRHFLFVPKRDYSSFSMMNYEEWGEVLRLARVITRCLEKRFPRFQIYFREGLRSGRSQRRFHVHLVLTPSASVELLAKLSLFIIQILPRYELSDAQLETVRKRVEEEVAWPPSEAPH